MRKYRLQFGRILRKHKFVLVIAVTIIIFALSRAINWEISGKAAELMVEPLLERGIELFTRDAEEEV